ncbi:hypothetical protein CKO25_07485 [Thiocapsa imhoffii]|uniref:YkgJ family cysteine cluster protein n=2 Tax=Thiocapsa imhoffii TaxID=382777 RepID=A0A9X0WH62_9GAMM|nr:YkgJ family cysteine cluster protein [Thiocapsa imhoffii]MBK1644498.1 hypothetical protein [Thiocapsa imhoffii]
MSQPSTGIDCAHCPAACCRLEVWCLTETGVPEAFMRADPRGGTVMARLDDGWCIALDRQTLLCRIYEQRPLVCRELRVGSPECLAEHREFTESIPWHHNSSRFPRPRTPCCG